MNRTALILTVAGTIAIASVTIVNAQPSDSGRGAPRSAFFVGGGVAYSFANFGTQSVYNKGISDAFIDGALVASGTADGPPVSSSFDSQSNLAPVMQLGYFQHFGSSNWLWGAKFSYSYLDTTSGTQNLIIPQFGTSTNPNVSTFTGYSVTGSYSVSIYSQMAAMLLVGRSFEKGFVYLGAGPSLSRIQGSLDNVVGFATINGILTNISGAPQSFSSSDWRHGAAATAGITYFLAPSWFLDVSYLFIAPNNRTVFATSPFNNPGDGTVAFSGTLIGLYTANLKHTQAVAISINKAF
jgi:opacity protein-like surface antigen